MTNEIAQIPRIVVKVTQGGAAVCSDVPYHRFYRIYDVRLHNSVSIIPDITRSVLVIEMNNGL